MQSSAFFSGFRLSAAKIAALLAAIFLAGAAAAVAQQAPLSGRLPANTAVYWERQANPAWAAAEAQNHSLQLLADPEIQSLEQRLLAACAATVDKSNPAVLQAAAPLVLSLLQNSFVVGMTLPPAPALPAKASPKGASKGAAFKPGFFLVYDATGKQALLQTAVAFLQQAGGTSSSYEYRGVRVQVRKTPNMSLYVAQTSQYLLAANESHLIADLVTRFTSSSGLAEASLGGLPEYREMQANFAEKSSDEIFVRVDALAERAAEASGKPQARQLVHALRLEKVRAAGYSVSYAGEATHARGAILGDASSGTLFDVAGASAPRFSTEPLAAGSAEFSVSRWNPQAVYHLIEQAARELLPPAQAANITAVESQAQAFLGISLDDGFGLFNGELARATSYSPEGQPLALYAVTIQKADDVLRIIRAVAAPMTLSEDSTGNTTVIEIAVPYQDPATHMKRRKPYYLGVTPQMLLVAPRRTMILNAANELRAAPAHARMDPAPNGLLASPEFLQLRARLPEKLSGLAAMDFTQVPWTQLMANLAAGAEAGLQAAAQNSKGKFTPPDLSWLQSVKLGAIPRHLHMSAGGWWKDSAGIYFEEYVQ